MTNWVDLVTSGGTIVVLAAIVWLFVTGKLVSSKIAKDQLQASLDAAKSVISKDVVVDIQKAVKDGFIEGWYVIHTSHQEAIDEVESRASAIKEPKTQPRKQKEKPT